MLDAGWTEQEIKDLAWQSKIARWPEKKLGPALAMGVTEAWQDFAFLFQTAETDIDPVTGQPRERKGADLMLWQIQRMLINDFKHWWEQGVLQKNQVAYNHASRTFGPNDPATLEALERIRHTNQQWASQSFVINMVSEYLSRYGSWDKFADTLYNRPDKILVDLADFVPAPPLAAIFRKAKVSNIYDVAGEAREWLRKTEDFDYTDEVNELLGYVDRNENLVPDILANPTSPLQNRVDGSMLTNEIIEEWDDAPDIFYRVTDRDRMHQQYSWVVAEAPLVRLDYYDLLQESGDYHIGMVENQYGELMGIKEIYTSREDGLVYPGPNTVKTLDEAIAIASSTDYKGLTGWDWIRRQNIENPVIQVIRGNELSYTWDGDGIVIRPEETIGVFNYKVTPDDEPFRKLIEELESY